MSQHKTVYQLVAWHSW